jgi:hypothetical protein
MVWPQMVLKVWVLLWAHLTSVLLGQQSKQFGLVWVYRPKQFGVKSIRRGLNRLQTGCNSWFVIGPKPLVSVSKQSSPSPHRGVAALASLLLPPPSQSLLLRLARVAMSPRSHPPRPPPRQSAYSRAFHKSGGQSGDGRSSPRSGRQAPTMARRGAPTPAPPYGATTTPSPSAHEVPSFFLFTPSLAFYFIVRHSKVAGRW